MSTYVIGTHNSDIRDVLKSYIIARYYGFNQRCGQYYDYSPSQVEAILFGILQLTPEHQDIIVIDLKKHLKSFIQDKDQAEEMITQYTCYYNAIKRWESNHKETEILHQLEISNLLEQLKNN